MTAILLASLLLATQAQAGGDVPDRRSLSPAQHYLNSKQREFQSRSAAVGRMGADAKVRGILGMLEKRSAFAKADVIGNSPSEQDNVRAALRQTAAYNMVAFGLGPDTLNGPAGETRLAALERLTMGRETLDDLVALGERIVVAEVSDDLPKGAVSSRLGTVINFKVAESIKGPPGSPTIQASSLVSPMFADAPKGQRYLLFLSPTMASFKQAEGVATAGNGVAFQFVPYKLDGQALVRIDSTQTDPAGATLEQVRTSSQR